MSWGGFCVIGFLSFVVNEAIGRIHGLIYDWSKDCRCAAALFFLCFDRVHLLAEQKSDG